MGLFDTTKKRTFRDKLGNEVPETPGAIPQPQSQMQSENLVARPPAYSGKLPPAPAPKAIPPAAPADDRLEPYLIGVNTGTKFDAEQTPEPKSFQALLAELRRVPTGLSAEDKKIFEGRVNELNQRLDQEAANYEARKNKLEWAEVADTIGQAAVQLMAGAEASRSPGKTANIVPAKIDWESRFDRAMRDFDSRKDTIEKQRSAVEKEMDRADTKVAREGERTQNWMVQDFGRTQNQYASNAREDAEEATRKGADQAKLQREADEKAKKITLNYELAGDAIRRLEGGEFKGDTERRKLESEIVERLAAAGNTGAVKALQENVDEKGFFLWKSKDYSKLKNYVDLNSKSAIINHYKGYGLPIPGGNSQATPDSSAPAAQSDTVERMGPDGRIVIYDAKTKQPLGYKK